MSPRFRREPRPWSGPDRAPSNRWVIRAIVVVAMLVVVVALVYAIATGTLFTRPGHG